MTWKCVYKCFFRRVYIETNIPQYRVCASKNANTSCRECMLKKMVGWKKKKIYKRNEVVNIGYEYPDPWNVKTMTYSVERDEQKNSDLTHELQILLKEKEKRKDIFKKRDDNGMMKRKVVVVYIVCI